MTRPPETIADALEILARIQPAAIALQAPDHRPLSYAELSVHARYVQHRLAGWGIVPGDIVAGFVASRPTMALACATLPASATFAPLGGSLPRQAYVELLQRLRPKAVLVPEQQDHALVAAASELGIARLEVVPEREAPAGRFALELAGATDTLRDMERRSEEYAYVLVTSGTTGRPKLVPLTHRQVVLHAEVMKAWLQYSSQDVGCHLLPLHLGHGLRNALMVPLLCGLSTVCLAESDLDGFFASIDEFRPTFLTAGFALYRGILRRAHDHRERLARSRFRFLRVGAGRLEPHELDRLEQTLGAPALTGLSLTESSAVTQDPLPPRPRKREAVGLPLACEIAVMSTTDQFGPVGSTGEIVVRGPLVLREYLDDSELNARSFVGDWFRTGDLGHVDEDGYVYITGRIKEIINRGGEKISPVEIDSVLESLEGVREAAAFGVPHASLGEELVAAVVREAGSAIDERQIIEHVRRRNGPSRLPRRIYFVERLPRTDTGKVRRGDLPKLVGFASDEQESSARSATAEGSPLSALEEAVGALYARLLGIGNVGRNDDFFLLGGDSLSGAQLIAQVRAAFGIDVPIRALFGEAATVAGMARMVEKLRGEGVSARRDRIDGIEHAPQEASISRRRLDESAELSHTQRRAWFLARLDPGNPAYNERRAYRLTGPIDVAILRASLQTVVARHEILRTKYAVIDGGPRQLPDQGAAIELQFIDISMVPAADRNEALRKTLTAESDRSFDLDLGPPARFALIRVAEGDHVLLRVWHHIVADGRSASIFERELSGAYNALLAGRPVALSPLPLQYADYATWQNDWLGGEQLDRQLAYWKGKLKDLPTLRLPTDRIRPSMHSSRGARYDVQLAHSLVAAVNQLGRGEGATLFMTMLAAFLVLLHRYTGEQDIVVGTPIAGRNRSELDGLIGFFANTLVLRADLSHEPTFLDALAQVRESALDAYTHQDVPFEKLVEELAPKRDLSRNPLFQVCFALQNAPAAALALDGIGVCRMTLPASHAKFDLTLTLRQIEGDWWASWEYCADLFEARTIERMATHFQRLLASIVAAPMERIGRLSLHESEEREQLLFEWNRTTADYPRDACVHELVETQAARAPESVAMLNEGRALTYGELNERANQLAHHLRALGVGPDRAVGVCLERGPDLVVGMLGILKAGGAYVPLDPELPRERVAFLLKDAGAQWLVTRQQFLGFLPKSSVEAICLDRDAQDIGAHGVDNGRRSTRPDDLACVMYTSGSTGTPKGVAIPHRAISRLVCGADYVQLTAGDVVAQIANPVFDAATFEIWGALVNGARLAVIPREILLSARALADALDQHGVSTLFVTTAMFNQIASDAPAAFSGRQVLFGGEAVAPQAVKTVLEHAKPRRLLHVYGPTEATTFATWHEVNTVDPGAITVPIGKPIANTEVYILDRYQEPVPVGIQGEICIGGPGLARGYLGLPELTAERFVAHPFDRAPGARLYRTGDYARRRPDGAIEFLGRLDRQVKIRGHRVEPGELEAALLKLPQIREACVVVHGSTTETRQLTAYVVAVAGALPTPMDLWRELRCILPEYMVPSAFVILKAMPLNANGKLDRSALPDPSDLSEQRTGWHMPPRDPLEQMLAGIWEDLLGLRNIGVRDSFFDLGGHSLLAARMMDAVERACGCSVPLTTLFTTSTIEHLAQSLRGTTRHSKQPVVALNAAGTRPPFFFLHGDFSGGGFYSRELARALGPDQPFYAVHPHGLDDPDVPVSIQAMAADRVRSLRALRPNGPYALGGHCNGAMVALEMARLLLAEGERVPIVVLLDAKAPWQPVQVFTGVTLGENVPRPRRVSRADSVPRADAVDIFSRYRRAIMDYKPDAYPGRLAVLRSEGTRDMRPSLGWSTVAKRVQTYTIPGDHHTSITRHAGVTGAKIKTCLDAAFRQTETS